MSIRKRNWNYSLKGRRSWVIPGRRKNHTLPEMPFPPPNLSISRSSIKQSKCLCSASPPIQVCRWQHLHYAGCLLYKNSVLGVAPCVSGKSLWSNSVRCWHASGLPPEHRCLRSTFRHISETTHTSGPSLGTPSVIHTKVAPNRPWMLHLQAPPLCLPTAWHIIGEPWW